MKHGDLVGKTWIFSDEKWVYPGVNRRNDKVIWRQGEFDDAPDDLRVVGAEQRPAGLMFLGVVASNGLVAPPIFIDAGQTVNAEHYQQLLAQKVRPWIDANFPPGTCVWQQDGARPHTASATQKYLADTNWTFLNASEWPPSSPDLAPLDYAMWDPQRGLPREGARPGHLAPKSGTSLDQAGPEFYTQKLSRLQTPPGGLCRGRRRVH